MQLMIDTAAETPDALDLAAAFLRGNAALKRAVEAGAGMPHVPMGTGAAVAPSLPAETMTPPAPFAPAAATPAALTPNNSTATVAPPPPPAPPSPTSAPVATTPATPAPPSPSSVAPVLPGASGAPPAVDEFDRAGVPWDVRIHQDGKSQKKDGTWKLRKKIDTAVVEAVMRELTPRIRVMTPTMPAGTTSAQATVSAPPAPPTVLLPQAPPPPVPQSFGEAPPPPATPTAYASPPLPPPPPPAAAPPIPGAEAQAPVDPFRALVAKITKARAEKKLTPEEVTAAVTGAGVASLQLLNAMPHKVAEVEANIDTILATR